MFVKEKSFGNLIEWQWAMEDSRVQTPMFTSAYFIDGILFDTGAPGGLNEFQQWCNSIGKEQIKACYLTHAHEDHSGGANWLQQEWQLPIYSSLLAKHILEKDYIYPDYRQVTWGAPLGHVNTHLFPEKIATSGRKYKFEILPTPGHAPCQVAFLERTQGWLIVADAVQPKYRMIFGGTSNIQEDIHQIHDSILELYRWTEGVANLQIFPAGQEMVMGREVLKIRAEEIEALHTQAHKLAKQGLTEKKQLKEMFGGESAVGILTRSELSRVNLLHSLLKWSEN